MADDSTHALVDRLTKQGDEQALAELFSQHRSQLQRIVEFRMDPRLAKRVDSSDVLQQAYLDAQTRIAHFASRGSMPFFVWIRHITLQTLVDFHRRHLGSRMRDARREQTVPSGGSSNTTSFSLARQLVGSLTSPSQAAVRRETVDRLRDAIDSMDEMDRQVLVLRHFEELTNKQVAQILAIEQAAASNRYVRALKRLQDILSNDPAVP